MLECKQSQIQQFFQIQGQITPDVLIRFVPKSNSSETLWAYMWQGQFSYDLAVELIYLPVSWFNGHFPPIQSHDFIFHSVTSLCRRNTVCFDFGKKDS